MFNVLLLIFSTSVFNITTIILFYVVSALPCISANSYRCFVLTLSVYFNLFELINITFTQEQYTSQNLQVALFVFYIIEIFKQSFKSYRFYKTESPDAIVVGGGVSGDGVVGTAHPFKGYEHNTRFGIMQSVA